MVVALFVVSWTPNLFSCSCISLPLCEHIADASAIAFIGRVFDDGQGKKNVDR